MPDARKSLDVLANEWESCSKCDLGVRRHDPTVNGRLVFGGGVTGGMMFIGDGPGSKESDSGRAFVDSSGKFLRFILGKLKMEDNYFTNAVICRSCAHVFDSLGRPLFMHNGNQRINDEPPTPAQSAACSARLMEQIYIVDPVLIVTLGPEAAAILTGKPVSATMSNDRGTFRQIDVPGVWRNAVVTEKKKQWVRKVKGVISAPTEQNYVQYLAMLATHPSYALCYVKDNREKNVFSDFCLDVQKAVHVYKRYLYEIDSSRGTNTQDINTTLNMDELEEYVAEL